MTKIKNLFIEPALFFENPKNKLGKPFLITLAYAVIAAVCTIPNINVMAAAAPMPGLSTEDAKSMMMAGSAAGAFFMTFVAWFAMSLLFFIALKIFARPSISLKKTMNITAYGAVPLACAAIIEALITLLGSPYPWASIILDAAVLFLTIPIWVKGFEAFGAGPEKKVLTAVIIAAAIAGIVVLISTISTLIGM